MQQIRDAIDEFIADGGDLTETDRASLIANAQSRSETAEEAHNFLSDHEHVFGTDTWEWEFTEIDFQFALACYAIDRVVSAYRPGRRGGRMSLYYQDEHIKLYHGDCLTEHCEWVDGDVLVTDPPYGGTFRSRHGWRSGESKKLRIKGDGELSARDGVLEAWGDKPALVFGFWRRPMPPGTRQMIVWDKRGGNGFSGDYKMPWADATEQIYVLGRDWVGKRVPAIYSIPSLHSASPERYGHPTPKPVALMSELADEVSARRHRRPVRRIGSNPGRGEAGREAGDRGRGQ